MDQTTRDAKLVALIQALMKTEHGLGLIGSTLHEAGLSIVRPGDHGLPALVEGSDVISRLLEGNPESVTKSLDAAGFALLRQIEKTPFPIVTDPDRLAVAMKGTILDTETTGLEPGKDRIVQLAMLDFMYDEKGILSLGGFFNEYHDPGVPMSAEASAVTGITDEMLKGKKITTDQLAAHLDDVTIVVAHNAAFDRKFCEADFPEAGFDAMAWHCSMAQIDWQARGSKGRSLELLALGEGYVYGAHDAYSDVAATAFALNNTNADGRTAFAEMFERGLTGSILIIAEKSPFETKDDLKANGYSWSADGTETGGIKAWFKVLARTDENVAAEGEFLRGIYGRDVSLPAWEMDQTTLYSARKPSTRATFRTAEARTAMDNLRMTADLDQPSLL